MTQKTHREKLTSAMQFQQDDKLDTAESLYREVLYEHPHDADALHGLGMIYIQRKNYSAALPWLQKAVMEAPQVPAFHNNLGNVYKALLKPQEAIQHYYEALRLKSPYPEVRNNLGGLLLKQGMLNEAIEQFQKAVREAPDRVDAHYNLANAYITMDRFLDAESHYQQVLRLKPDHLGALHNLSMTLITLKNFAGAKPLLKQVVEREPTNTDALFHLGIIEGSDGNIDEARLLYERVLKHNSAHDGAHHNLATVLLHQENKLEALEHYRRALALNPNNKTAFHMIQSLQGETSEEGAPPEYIRALFDQYAYNYNQHVKESLDYQVPAKLREAITPWALQSTLPWRILDLGCGTGLCAPFFVDLSEKLIGVDISSNMITVAKNQGGYDKLITLDILQYLQHTDDRFHLVIAADVLVYFGQLHELFVLVKRVLHEHSIFAFSVEILDGETVDFTLKPTGRYAHSSRYVATLAQSLQFEIVHQEITELRKQDGVPVMGCLFLVRKEA